MIARIQVRTDPGALEIQRTDPRVEIQRTEADLTIHRRQPQVSYDRSDYQDAVGVLPSTSLGRRLAATARQETARATRQIAVEGDQLGRIEDGTTIATVAKAELHQDDVELHLAAVPPPRRTTVDPGGLDVRIRPGELRIDAELGRVTVTKQPHTVTVHTEVPSQVNARA